MDGLRKLKIFFDETQKERGKISTNYSMLRDSLKNDGFEVEEYNDFPISDKSLKCNVFVFACPDGSKLAKGEIDALVTFVERGGGLLVIGNAGGDRGLRTNMSELLNIFGVEMLSDQVKDDKSNEFNMPTHPVIKDIKPHPITQGVAELVIVAGCSLRGSSNMKGVAYTSPAADPPNIPVVIAGEYKNGRVAAVGSYRLFSNYGAGLGLRNNRTFALNTFRWLSRTEGKTPITSTAKSEIKAERVTSITPPYEPQADRRSSYVPSPQTTQTSTTQYTRPLTPTQTTITSSAATSLKKNNINDQSVLQEIERLRTDITEMREIIARLYSDTLGYLQEMKEEVRSMLDYIRTKGG